MFRNFLLLFLALRAADILNLVGGMWLVPKFVAPEDLGAVLPLTTLATLIAIPLYAVAMTALRESSRLRSESARSGDRSPSCSSTDTSRGCGIPSAPASQDNRGCGIPSAPADAQLHSFIRGVFAASGIAALIALAVAAALLPRYIHRANISDSLSGYLAVAAALLGCVSPIYLDQLQAAKKFGTVSIIEISAAASRLCVMAALMPFRALAGYFAGAIIKPLVQILGPILTLKCGRGIPAACKEEQIHYWTRANLLRLAKTFLLLLPYLALPMYVSFTENDLIRTLLPADDSAGYYMATRISDLLNYITFPVLFVMFPYVTDKSSRGESYLKIIYESIGVIFLIATPAAIITMFFGADILAWIPNGENYSEYAHLIPMLIFFMAFGAAQSIITNADVAAGNFKFLFWLIPLNIAYVKLLPWLHGLQHFELSQESLEWLVLAFTVFAAIRVVAAQFLTRRK